MNPESIQAALIGAAKSTAEARGLAPVLPGYEYPTMPVPCVVFDYVPTNRPAVTLKGGEILREDGIFSASIVVEQGEGTAAAHGHAAAIAAVYPEATRLAFTGGRIAIMAPADIRQGYPDGSHWRVPVVVNYRADATS